MRKLAVGLCAFALALTGVACGDEGTVGGGVPGGVNALAAAAEKANAAGSSAMSMTMTMTVQGSELTAEAEGVVDYEQLVGELRMTIDGPGVPPVMEGLEIEVIYDDLDGYMRMPPELGLGRGWYHMDLAEPSVDATGLGELTQDPSQFLDFLYGTSEDIESLGTEEIRGVSTTHYEAEVSLDKALEQAPNQEAVDRLEAKFGDASDVSFPLDAWIDEDGLPRRIELSTGVTAGQPGAMDVSVDFYDFGVEVDVEPPEKFKELPG